MEGVQPLSGLAGNLAVTGRGVPRACPATENGWHEPTVSGPTAGRPVIFGRRSGLRAGGPADAGPAGPPANAEPVGLDDAAPDHAALDDAALDDAAVDDAALVERARTDAEAFGVLYDRYCDRILRYVSRRLYDSQSAEDVTAEVFFKALRALDGYRPETAPFSAWLYRIAANTVVDVLRARRPTAPLEHAPDLPDSAASVEQQVVDRTEVDRVWAAVDQLTDAQRTAVTLRLGEDLPIAQIAAQMGRSEGAVKLLLNRGLSAVRELLDPVAGAPPARAEPIPRPDPDEEVRR